MNGHLVGCSMSSTPQDGTSPSQQPSSRFLHYLELYVPDQVTGEGKKYCAIRLRVHVPQGMTTATVEVKYGILDRFPRDTDQGDLDTGYLFQGNRLERDWHTFKGRGQGQYTSRIDVRSFALQPCGAYRYLNMCMWLSIDSARDSYVMVRTTEVTITTTDHFGWLPCPTK
ncbi:DUF4360 domain-containing protein [Pendulispora brunnea]|uniref:DUF4360 domain-containing protein n=1 Tax=Pendulispora brunnea TaxID=2905690 RepID=A0ABZ2KNR8_9BACT